MRDEALIYTGLAVFLGLITFPISYNAAAGTRAKAPELKMPATAKLCVAPVETMRRAHMELLLDWRDQVVRRGVRTYRSAGGRSFEISLSRTCLEQCHSSKQDFCDRCHGYVGVKGPYCMDCHVDPKLVAEGRR